jgi:hypothetical protein
MCESAVIDGANDLQILLQVILPISLPALATLATLQFTWIWNDFLWPIIFTQSNEVHTIMVGLITFKSQYSVASGARRHGADGQHPNSGDLHILPTLFYPPPDPRRREGPGRCMSKSSLVCNPVIMGELPSKGAINHD